MTTIANFRPTALAPFQFQATLDGNVYNCIVTWNLFGARWYLNVYDLSGNLIVSEALVGSPVGFALQGLVWDQERGIARAATALPLGLKVGSTVNLTISGVTPAAYNGDFSCFVTDPQGFSYVLAEDPGGAATVLGAATYNINLIGRYFSISRIVFRDADQQFEISP